MSNSLAVATVTAALADLVTSSAGSAVSGASARVGRPQASATGALVYVYLYQVSPNAALRNDDLPTRGGDGTLVRRPQAALTLHYLLAFHGKEAEFEPERMLGAVVRDLHADPILTRHRIQTTIANWAPLAASDLAAAPEHVRLSPSSLSLEELSKLWSVFFQVPYSVTIAYDASVVLIEPDLTPVVPQPVLRRGEHDRGVITVIGPYPQIDRIHIGDAADADAVRRPPPYPAAELGRTLLIEGSRFASTTVFAFRHTRQAIAIEVVPDTITDTLAVVSLPINAAQWAAGVFEVVAQIPGLGADPPRLSNAFPIAVAPTVTSIAPSTASIVSGEATFTLTCLPNVRVAQRAVLLVSGRETVAEPRAADTDPLVFVIDHAVAVQNAVVRVRVDGVDSIPFRRSTTTPGFEIDPAQKVSIQ